MAEGDQQLTISQKYQFMKLKYSKPNYGYMYAVLAMQFIWMAPIVITPERLLMTGILFLLGVMMFFLLIGGFTVRQYVIKGDVLICRYMNGIYSSHINLSKYYKYTTNFRDDRATGVRWFADMASLFSDTNMLKYKTIKLHKRNKEFITIEAKFFANEIEYNEILVQVKSIIKNNGNIKL